MKKTYTFLSFLMVLLVSGTVNAQGGADCTVAPDIPIGTSSVTNNCGTEWYAFTAPGDGEVVVDFTGGTSNKSFRLYTGTCPSPLTQVYYSNTWSSGSFSNPPLAMTAGETIYIQFFNDWGCGTFDFDVSFDNPLCPNPDGLNAVVTSYSSADLTWVAGGSETDWIVEWGPAGFTPGTGTMVPVSGTPSLTLTTLAELSDYEFYVTSDCGAESSFQIGPYAFSTPALCPQPLFPFVSGITTEDATLNWSAGAAEVIWDVEWGLEGVVLGSGTFVDNTPFTTEALTGLTGDTDYDFYVRAVCDLNLADGVDTVSLWVGPNEWTQAQICPEPTGLGAIEGDFDATLSWTPGGSETEWSIQYGEAGFILGSGTSIVSVVTNPFILSGLTPETDYEYYVRATCGSTSDSLSGWAGPFGFTTQVFCDAPTSVVTTGVTFDEATASWDAGTGTDWTVEYGLDGFTPGTGTTVTTSVFPTVTLTGLDEGTGYCYYVRSDCGSTDDSTSVWSGPHCFTTQSLCPDPSGLDAINITETAANLIFTPGGSEVSWNLEWGAPGFTVEAGEEEGSVTETTDNPHYATGLTNSTPYWYYVQAVCGVDTASSWVGPFLFGTDIVNDQPCDAIKITVDSPQRRFHNFLATFDGTEYLATPPSTGDCYAQDGWCSGDYSDNSVWFYFTAPLSGAVNVSTFDESTDVTNNYTEIAVYSIGDCSEYSSFTLEGANTLAEEALEPPYGSELTLCGLTPGETYYVLVNNISFISSDVTFGLEVTSIADVEAGVALNPTVCAETVVDLFTTIASPSDFDGQWYNPTAEAGNEVSSDVLFPAGLGSYDFYYVVENGCDADTVMTTVSTTEAPNAGGDGSYVGCNTFDIVLSDHLTGAVDAGGTWIDNDATGAVFGGTFVSYGLDPGVYTFTYTVSNTSCPTDSATVTVTLTQCLGVDEESLAQLEVFPNPVVDVLTLKDLNIEGAATIEVLDVQGKVIMSNSENNIFGNYEIDMSELEDGVYVIQILTENATQQVRVVKK